MGGKAYKRMKETQRQLGDNLYKKTMYIQWFANIRE